MASTTEALGMIETKGMVGSVEAADAMVKAAQRPPDRQGLSWAAAWSPSSSAATWERSRPPRTPARPPRSAWASSLSVHVIPRPDGMVESILPHAEA